MGPHNKDVSGGLYLTVQRINGRVLKKRKKEWGRAREVCIEKFKNPLVTGINSWDLTLRKSKLEENI